MKKADTVCGASVVCAALIFIFFHGTAAAVQGDYGSEGVFMTGAGSRPDGMGGAFTAAADDLSAMHYNPAGLANLKKQAVSILYYPLYESASYGSAAYGQALLDFGTIGISVYRFSADGMQGYDMDGNPTSVFGSEQYKITIGYGRAISGAFSAGANVNVYYSNISRYNYAGAGADIGLLYMPFQFLRAGLMVRNAVTPVFSMQSVTENLPRMYTLGLLARHKAGDFELKAAADISAGEKEGFKDRFGFEADWLGTASVRAGYCDGGFTFGAGLSLFDVRFDYAYISNGDLGGMDRFTVSYVFGMTLDAQKEKKRREIYNEVRRLVEAKVRIKIKEEAEALYSRAYAHYQKGEYGEALAKVEKSLEWKRDYEPSIKMKKILGDKIKEKLSSGAGAGLSEVNDVYVTAGIEFYEKMQYDEAIKRWEQALKNRPGNKAIKSMILTAQKEMESVPKKLQVTKEQREMADKLYYLAVNSYTAGDLKGAIDKWKKVLAIDPEDVKTLRDLKKAQAELEELSRRGIE
ncbi:MAG: PorV/PorQ family protein [Spirochaetia bacterium]|nr:PorV/PorQ family protein [Spirochaetia bacterium]